MSEIGQITGVFRYPVKSMLGEELESTVLGVNGIPGDRAWGVRDEQRADFFTGKRCAPLMSCSAAYADPSDTSSAPQVRLPDGGTFPADAKDAGARIAAAIDRDVTLWPVVAEARRARPKDDVNVLQEIQGLLAREGGERVPDLSNPQPELLEVYARGGPFFDAFPIMLITSRSIESIAAAAPDSQIDDRRFRPNLLLETSEPGAFPEQEWIGLRIQVGDATLKIQSTCMRCVMTTHGFADVPKDTRVMRTLVKEAEGNLGVYATVEVEGEARRGDSVVLLD